MNFIFQTANHITIFNGKIHYKWVIFNSYVKLPEGIGNVIIPTDEPIFFGGVGSTTR